MNIQLFAGGKTEPATPKKRQDIRKKGQVFQSKEITSALILITGFSVLYLSLDSIVNKFINLFKYLFYTYPGANDEVFTVKGIERFGNVIFSNFIGIILPIILAVFLISVVVTYAQVGFLFTLEPLNIKIERINPFEGFKRIFSKKALLELVKAVAKISIMIYVIYSFLIGQYKGIPELLDMSVQDIMKYSLCIISGVLLKISIVLIVLSIIDYIFQWREFESNIKMSKDDIKEEFKETEGNPQIKSAIKRKQRQISMRRMMKDISKADVIITNPTHIAVALMYDNKINDAPIVIAKGQDLVAIKIKEEAQKYNIAIVENKPLAQALYKSAEIGDIIPPELYQAVAEVLAYVYSLKEE
jgi:flagellar biosynthetic protein FlhB